MKIKLVRGKRKYHLKECPYKGTAKKWEWAKGKRLEAIKNYTDRYPADTVQPCAHCLIDVPLSAEVV